MYDPIKTGDVFNPKCVYYLVTDTIEHKDEKMLEAISQYHSAFDLFEPTQNELERFNNSMYFIEITPLGKNFGKCCCE